MWSLWAIAYVLGFAHDSVVHAYDGAGSHLGTVADQEITTFLLWAAAGVAFAPVDIHHAAHLAEGRFRTGRGTRGPKARRRGQGLGTPGARPPSYPGPVNSTSPGELLSAR